MVSEFDDPALAARRPWRVPVWVVLVATCVVAFVAGLASGYGIGWEDGWWSGRVERDEERVGKLAVPDNQPEIRFPHGDK